MIKKVVIMVVQVNLVCKDMHSEALSAPSQLRRNKPRHLRIWLFLEGSVGCCVHGRVHHNGTLQKAVLWGVQRVVHHKEVQQISFEGRDTENISLKIK